MEFYGESYGAYHVTASRCTKKFLYEKPRKSRKNHEYSRIIEHVSAFLAHPDVLIHMKKSKIKYMAQKKLRKILGIQLNHTISLESFNKSRFIYFSLIEMVNSTSNRIVN